MKIATYCPDCNCVSQDSTRCVKCGKGNLPIGIDVEYQSQDAQTFRQKDRYRAPDHLTTKSPAEMVEYHIQVHKEQGRIPTYFKLSDEARNKLIEIVTSIRSMPWLDEHAVTHAIYSFITGWIIGRDESAR